MDFTIKLLPKLYKALQSQGFSFFSVSDILQHKEIFSKYVILRHDVEKYYENALEFARIQNELGIRGVYYFRISEKHFNPDIVKQINNLGHEVGYHYDDLTQCKGNYDFAIKRFENNLNMLREIAPVKTICMDGSPLSKFDNKDLWKKYNYKDFGIIGEPYFDINFSEVLYLTDTGRMWDGGKVSVRDKVGSKEYGVGSKKYGVRSKERIGEKEKVRKGEGASERRDEGTRQSEDSNRQYEVGSSVREGEKERRGEKEKGRIGEWVKQSGVVSRQFVEAGGKISQQITATNNLKPETCNLKHETRNPFQYRFHSTNDIIKAANEGRLPDKIMMTFHPQRWHDHWLPWFRELIWQNIKNKGKGVLIYIRKK